MVEPRAPIDELEIGGRIHLQFNTTSADTVPGSEFLLRRARVWVNGRVNEWIDGVAQVDFGGGQTTARFAFVRLWFGDALQLSFGQFKRAFDLFELTSSSQILAIERTGSIRGVEGCAGLDGVCSYSRLSEGLELSSLDIGVLATGALSEKIRYRFTLTNGTGGNAREENGTKSYSGRLEFLPVPNVRIGANLAFHDFPNPVTGNDEYAPAVALDLELGDFERGLHVQLGVLAGENWQNLSASGEPGDFLATQGIVTYRIPVQGERVHALEPLMRVSWADPDRDVTGDAGLLFTPGFVAHFEGRNKVAANVDIWSPTTGATEWSLKLQTYVYF